MKIRLTIQALIVVFAFSMAADAANKEKTDSHTSDAADDKTTLACAREAIHSTAIQEDIVSDGLALVVPNTMAVAVEVPSILDNPQVQELVSAIAVTTAEETRKVLRPDLQNLGSSVVSRVNASLAEAVDELSTQNKELQDQLESAKKALLVEQEKLSKQQSSMTEQTKQSLDSLQEKMDDIVRLEGAVKECARTAAQMKSAAFAGAAYFLLDCYGLSFVGSSFAAGAAAWVSHGCPGIMPLLRKCLAYAWKAQ